MFEEMKKIVLSGETYPIKCDLVVLEMAQNKYGSISNFEDGLITWEKVPDEDGEPVLDEDGIPKLDEKGEPVKAEKVQGKFPDVQTVNDALYWMIKEGETCAAEQEGRTRKEIAREELLRKADMRLIALANTLHDEFFRCLMQKNEETT